MGECRQCWFEKTPLPACCAPFGIGSHDGSWVRASHLEATSRDRSIQALDRRFVLPRASQDFLNREANLACLGPHEFEHLVRELFEKVLSPRGFSVNVTKPTHDGGVDVVAIDSHPLTRSKIVIQVKRYSRNVGVSAVRELSAIIDHERASRGILVTTADFAPSARRFALDKSITLMSGADLLRLLHMNGYAARIDLGEARQRLH